MRPETRGPNERMQLAVSRDGDARYLRSILLFEDSPLDVHNGGFQHSHTPPARCESASVV